MGLEERRRIKELVDVTLPGRVREIEEICGKPIPYEVDWESLASSAEALNFLDNVACHRLNMALRVLCVDELGKEAVREGLQKIRLANVRDVSEKRLSFDGGVLEMRGAYAKGLTGAFSDGEIRALLAAHL